MEGSRGAAPREPFVVSVGFVARPDDAVVLLRLVIGGQRDVGFLAVLLAAARPHVAVGGVGRLAVARGVAHLSLPMGRSVPPDTSPDAPAPRARAASLSAPAGRSSPWAASRSIASSAVRGTSSKLEPE